jgi:hypothetical protein
MLKITAVRHLYRFSIQISALLGLLFYPFSASEAAEGVKCTEEPTDMIVRFGDLVSCRINTPGDIDVFRFSGIAGQTVRVRATRLDWREAVRPFLRCIVRRDLHDPRVESGEKGHRF